MNSLLKKEIMGSLHKSFNLWNRSLTSKSFGNECSHLEWCLINFVVEWVEGNCLWKKKVALEWYCLKEVGQGHEEVPKPPLLKLALKIMLKILGNSNWGVVYIPWDAFLWIEKNEELGDIIFYCKLFYVRKANVTLWEWESNKSIQLEEMQTVFDFHAS